ncbi:MAG TPA: hypothetical protein VFQ16_09740 [Burkholderiaceae bacterium]|nr:hypothetical protein [Burkholderiaceae bacterium]
MSAWFRRREIVLPTWRSLLLLLGVVAALCVLAGRGLGGWLSVTEPIDGAEGAPARVLVVEGWLAVPELEAAAAFARARGYTQVATSGGPINDPFNRFENFAERAAAVLRARLPGVSVRALPTPPTAQNRTYASAVWVRDGLRAQGALPAALDVYSLGPHARRTRWMYQLAFGEGTRIGIVAGTPLESDPLHWWTGSESAKAVLGEAISLAWTACCFRPPPRGSHEERWAVPPR